MFVEKSALIVLKNVPAFCAIVTYSIANRLFLYFQIIVLFIDITSYFCTDMICFFRCVVYYTFVVLIDIYHFDLLLIC